MLHSYTAFVPVLSLLSGSLKRNLELMSTHMRKIIEANGDEKKERVKDALSHISKLMDQLNNFLSFVEHDSVHALSTRNYLNVVNEIRVLCHMYIES
jgi:ABC-type transporter Mla subunit MlaD